MRCLAFHPSGDYILVGTQHPTSECSVIALQILSTQQIVKQLFCNSTGFKKNAISKDISETSSVTVSRYTGKAFFLITWFTDPLTRFFRIWKKLFCEFFFFYNFSVVGPKPGIASGAVQH